MRYKRLGGRWCNEVQEAKGSGGSMRYNRRGGRWFSEVQEVRGQVVPVFQLLTTPYVELNFALSPPFLCRLAASPAK